MNLTVKNRHRFGGLAHDLVTKLCYHSARLYNVGLYNARQHFFQEGELLPYTDNYHDSKANENYSLLQTDQGQPILRLVTAAMCSFFAKRASKKHQQKCSLPGYKPKEGLSVLYIAGQRLRIRDGKVLFGFSKAFKEVYKPRIKHIAIPIPQQLSHVKKFQQLRIKPRFGGLEFDVEFVYEAPIEDKKLDLRRVLSIDLGLDNLMACFASPTGASFLLDGRYIKSLNQWYNKEKARLQSGYDKEGIKHPTKKMRKLIRRRESQIDDYFNRCVLYVVEYCIKHNIGTIVVGDFAGIKQGIELGKRNNQHFVSVPYWKLKRKLKAKCQRYGLKYVEVSESYTSVCSFLDGEKVQKQEVYKGKRVSRGLFRSGAGHLVNADVNGAANILVKYLESKRKRKDLDFGLACRGLVSGPARIGRVQLHLSKHCANQKAPS